MSQIISTGADHATATDAAARAAALDAIADRLKNADLFERLAAIRTDTVGRIVFTTSFGLEDQAIAHAIFSQMLAIDVATPGRWWWEQSEKKECGLHTPLRPRAA